MFGVWAASNWPKPDVTVGAPTPVVPAAVTVEEIIVGSTAKNATKTTTLSIIAWIFDVDLISHSNNSDYFSVICLV